MTDLIGNTPMFELPVRSRAWRVILKLEQFNPGRSMKDRMARGMVLDAEEKGLLRDGGTIVESSSGNTGTGLALVAAERGYRFVAVVDRHASTEKIRAMKAYGGEIVYVEDDCADGCVATKEREARAEAIAAQLPGSVYLRQPDNPANARAYYESLGDEIWCATDGKVSTLVGAVGTGGSLCGTARRLKELAPHVRTIGVEPVGSIIFGGPGGPYYQSGTGTPAGVEIGANVDFDLIDEGTKVSDAVAFNTARFLARRFGLLVGGSAGGVVHRALEVTARGGAGGVLVALVADGGEKYLDTIFDDEWMRARALLDPGIDTILETLLARDAPRSTAMRTAS